MPHVDDDLGQFEDGLPKTEPRSQSPIARQRQTGILPTLSLRDFKPVGLDESGNVQRMDPVKLNERFQQPAFGREATSGNVRPPNFEQPTFG